MTVRRTQLSPADVALQLARKLKIRPTGVTVGADGSITVFDGSGGAVHSAAHDRQAAAEAALDAWTASQDQPGSSRAA